MGVIINTQLSLSLNPWHLWVRLKALWLLQDGGFTATPHSPYSSNCLSLCSFHSPQHHFSLFVFLIQSRFLSSPTPLLWSWSKHLISVTHFPHMQTKGCYVNAVLWKCFFFFFFFLLQLSYIFSDFRRNIYPLVLLQPLLVFPTFLVHSQRAK